MESYTSRSITLAVSVFITVAITTAIIIVLGSVLDIYKNVSKIDYASLMRFNELDKYSVSEMENGIFWKSKTINGEKVNNEDLKGIQLYNFLNKIINKHNMKCLDDSEKYTIEDCIATYDKNNKVVLNTNTYILTVKCMSNNNGFYDSDGNFFSDTVLKNHFFCRIERNGENNEATLYFSAKQ